MSLLYSKKAAAIAIIASLPFIVAASYFACLSYTSPWPEGAGIGAIYSAAIFLLGSPLTLIYYFLLNLIYLFLHDHVSDYVIRHQLTLLAYPLLPILFIIQWIIWSQLIVLIVRRLRNLK